MEADAVERCAERREPRADLVDVRRSPHEQHEPERSDAAAAAAAGAPTPRARCRARSCASRDASTATTNGALTRRPAPRARARRTSRHARRATCAPSAADAHVPPRRSARRTPGPNVTRSTSSRYAVRSPPARREQDVLHVEIVMPDAGLVHRASRVAASPPTPPRVRRSASRRRDTSRGRSRRSTSRVTTSARRNSTPTRLEPVHQDGRRRNAERRETHRRLQLVRRASRREEEIARQPREQAAVPIVAHDGARARDRQRDRVRHAASLERRAGEVARRGLVQDPRASIARASGACASSATATRRPAVTRTKPVGSVVHQSWTQ